MADLNEKEASKTVRIVGGDEAHFADVILEGGEKKLRAKADVTVNSLRGFDPIADTWGFIGTEADSKGVGAAGDVVTVQILAGDDAALFPAVDVDTTVVVDDTEDDLADRIVANLTADANFALRFFARRINKRATTVYISAKEQGPQGERPNINDFLFTATGTTVVTRAFDKIIRQQKDTSLARDPADPTLGVLGISGSVSASQGEVSSRFVDFFKEPGSSDDMRVDGSSTAVDFLIEADPIETKFIESLRIEASGNGIKFGQFLSKSGAGGLTNGLELVIRSNNSELVFPVFRVTESFLNEFALGGDNFDLFIQAGGDQMRATLSFTAPFELQKQNTFVLDDFVRLRVQDNIVSGLTSLKALAFGFMREF